MHNPETKLNNFCQAWKDDSGPTSKHDPKIHAGPDAHIGLIAKLPAPKSETEAFRNRLFGDTPTTDQSAAVVEVDLENWAKYCAGKWFGFDGSPDLAMDDRFYEAYDHKSLPPADDLHAWKWFVFMLVLNAQLKKTVPLESLDNTVQ